MNVGYETERLILRILDETYAGAVLDYNLRNQEFMQEWEPLKPEDFYTLEHQRQILINDLNAFYNGSGIRLWIFKKDDPLGNRIIGMVQFSNIIRGDFLSCFLGYKLDKDEINKGYITEAVKVGIGIMFDSYGLHRIEANIMPKNLRSMRVAEKLGFHYDGLAKKYLRINGKWEDHVHMVIFNEKLEEQ